MNVFGIGLPEMAVIGAVALLVFGPKRLPELGRTLGKTLKGFQSASKEFEREINKAMADPDVEDVLAAAPSADQSEVHDPSDSAGSNEQPAQTTTEG